MASQEAAPKSATLDREVTADVVPLRRDVDQPFTYRAGSDGIHADSGSLTGAAVVIPLGSRLTVGLVVEVHSPNDPPDRDLKPIVRVIDTIRPLSAELIRLGRWMASYYVASPVHAFQLLMPPRYLPRPVHAWCVQENAGGAVQSEALRELFEPGETVTLDAVCEHTGWSASRVHERMKQFVEEEVASETVELQPPPVGRRRLNYLEPGGTSDECQHVRQHGSPREKELVEWLIEREGGFQRDLPDRLNRTDLIRRLEEKGVLTRSRRVNRRTPHTTAQGDGEVPDLELTDEQREVLEAVRPAVREGQFDVHLVHGVTGSGKTEVYFQLINEALDRDRTALVLVPEILLASFLLDRFRNRYGQRLAVLHSGLSEGERLDEWDRIQQGEASVVLGVQSAVLAPLSEVGLIVVDEEHDTSYKAARTPRYHARDVAVMRARQHDVPVVLGSATPSLESYANALRARYHKHEMKHRPRGDTPSVRVADLRGEDSLLTDSLVDSTRDVLDRDRKAIWFLNRRGLSNFLICPDCGSTVQCNNCHVTLTLHGSPRKLQCHYCGFDRPSVDRCEECGSPRIEAVGVGTEWLSDRAHTLFEGAEVIRLDSDTVTRKEARYRKLERFGESGPRLLVGTQMVTKGLDFEQVDFVGVVNADTGLQFPDFRAGERTFQQIVQVCGRAGRDNRSADVLVQTYNPGHYAILYAKRGDYRGFFGREADGRRALQYPPFGRLVNVTARGKDREATANVLETLRRRLDPPEGARWLGPSPCMIDYLKGYHRFHLLGRGQFSSEWKERLRSTCGDLDDRVRMTIDVDPVDLL